MLLVDLSGFSHVMYLASRDKAATKRILRAVQAMFARTNLAKSAVKDFKVINTTGDGFLALAGGRTPTRTALRAAQLIVESYDPRFASVLGQLPFRARVDLRIGLHHGLVYSYSMPTFMSGIPLYNSDDLNLLSRVTSSHTARRTGMACTKVFAERLALANPGLPAEVIVDKNVYPEPIEIYALPDEVPEYPPKKARQSGKKK